METQIRELPLIQMEDALPSEQGIRTTPELDNNLVAVYYKFQDKFHQI
jgi:hypothetical protein